MGAAVSMALLRRLRALLFLARLTKNVSPAQGCGKKRGAGGCYLRPTRRTLAIRDLAALGYIDLFGNKILRETVIYSVVYPRQPRGRIS